LIRPVKAIPFFLWCVIAPVLIYGFSELLVRILVPSIQPQGTDRILYAENRFGESHGLRPNSTGCSNGAAVHVDGNGFRVTSIRPDTAGVGWLLLGDSVTLGIGVEEDSTFSGILQSRFRRINVLNPSMIGWDVRDYVRVFRHYAVENRNRLNIDRVLVFWCMNDLYRGDEAAEMPGAKIRALAGKPFDTLRAHSRFYYFLKTHLFDRARDYYLFDSRLYSEGSPAVADAIGRLVELRESCRALQCRRPGVSRVPANKRIPNQNIRDGMAFTVVLLPYEYQLRDRIIGCDEPQRIMSAELESRGIEVLDALPYLRVSGMSSKKLYLYGDGIHMSAAGHRMIADFLRAHLGKSGRRAGSQKQFDFKPSVL
jgi:hypothetical protein